MKIGELDCKCGNCEIIDYCTEPYETPMLCGIEELEAVEEEEYIRLVKTVTEEQIKEKYKSYRRKNGKHWTKKRQGAICDIVIDMLEQEEV